VSYACVARDVSASLGSCCGHTASTAADTTTTTTHCHHCHSHCQSPLTASRAAAITASTTTATTPSIAVVTIINIHSYTSTQFESLDHCHFIMHPFANMQECANARATRVENVGDGRSEVVWRLGPLAGFPSSASREVLALEEPCMRVRMHACVVAR
jgi:hypothetical protein